MLNVFLIFSKHKSPQTFYNYNIIIHRILMKMKDEN